MPDVQLEFHEIANCDNALTKAVLENQDRMTQGIERLSIAAESTQANLDSITTKMREFRDGTVGALDGVRQSMTGLASTVNSSSRASFAKPFEGVGEAVDDVAKKTKELPSNIRNVFSGLGSELDSHAQDIMKVFTKIEGEVPSRIRAANTAISNEYEKLTAKQTKEFDDSAKKFEESMEKQSQATEKINAAVVKGTRSVIGAIKGFAELGIVSEDNSKKLLQNMIVIQGAFEILDGAVDLLEAVNSGIKAVRDSQKAAAVANAAARTSIASAVAGQVVQQGFLESALYREVAAANAATIAHSRLGAARAGASASGIAGAAGSVAAGSVPAAAGAVGAGVRGAATGAAAAGAGRALLSTSVLGISTGVIGSVAAFGAAAGGAAIAFITVKEALLGQAKHHKSVSFKIAEYEASILASILSVTGLSRALSHTKDTYAALARSNEDLAKAELHSAKFRFEQERQSQLRAASSESRSKQSIESLNANAAKHVNTASIPDGSLFERETGNQTLLQDKLGDLQKTIDAYHRGERVSIRKYSQAVTETGNLQKQLSKSIADQSAAADAAFNDKIKTEIDFRTEALKQQAEWAQKAADAEARGASSADEAKAAREAERSASDQITSSLERQKDLVQQQARVAAEGQAKVQAELRRQIDLQQSSLERVKNGYESAAINFAKLGAIEKRSAIAALDRARSGKSLDDTQKDLLRNVGTEEATRFANKADIDEARRSGFDRSFGRGAAQETAKILATKKTLEAQLATTYDVQVQLKFDETKVVRTIVDEVNAIMDKKTSAINTGIQLEFQKRQQEINSNTFKKDSLKKAQSG